VVARLALRAAPTVVGRRLVVEQRADPSSRVDQQEDPSSRADQQEDPSSRVDQRAARSSLEARPVVR
jgi:hypothetical protein